MTDIHIIDDDIQLAKSFSKILLREGYSVQTSFTGKTGIQNVLSDPPKLVVLDIKLPDINGIEVFEKLNKKLPCLPVIIITAFGDTETAIGAIKKGAFDYIYKPFDIPQMLELIKKGVDSSKYRNSPVIINPDEQEFIKEALIGNSYEMIEVYKSIGKAAPTDATVLIRGESGTGKELCARAVFHHSSRSTNPFIVINCVAIPETLLESELFGYEKGAFTGALHKKVGKIEQANKGTIFLDEIGDMPLGIQAKFLRLLQEKSIERLGGKDPLSVDVRVIAATNRNLEKAVEEGTFREDLYYRLKVVTITMPPLRNRKEDIPALSKYLLKKFAIESELKNPDISDEAITFLKSYDWPGNIRELFNVLQKAVIFNMGNPIKKEEISLPQKNQIQINEDNKNKTKKLREWIRNSLLSETNERPYEFLMDKLSEIIISEALSITGKNISKASKLLGVSRPTLHAKIEKFGIETKE
ncbi:MAG: sigma-54 dependent transcriptional regulator [Desulforegulaceae bacterium]|jgi:DNA-binding NtrC family response regulator|nr:sigma-54 dependent transcriptional regulator [Desulforegulaceae bacterium]